MPQRYIDAAGVDEMDTARINREASRDGQDKQEAMKLRLLAAVQSALDVPESVSA